MAVNWTVAQATAVILEGTNKEQIQDITRRFPLFAVTVAKGDLLAVAQATPEHLTVRKIESVMKEGVTVTEVEDEDVEEVVEEKPAKKAKTKAAKEEAPAKKAKGKKSKPAPEPEPEEEDEEDEDDDGYDEMNLVQLKKAAKKQKVDIKGLKTADAIIAALRGEDVADEEEDEDEDDEDWDI